MVKYEKYPNNAVYAEYKFFVGVGFMVKHCRPNIPPTPPTRLQKSLNPCYHWL